MEPSSLRTCSKKKTSSKNTEMLERHILHINIAHFFATVEALSNTSLKGEPFAIAPIYNKRAVVIDLSEQAFAEGLRKGDPIKKAKKMNIEIIEPNYDIYSRAETALYKSTLSFAPIVEKTAGGHLFLDVTGTKKIFGKPVDHASFIKRRIYEDFAINPIVSHSVNKLVAKVATRVVKPHGFISVIPGDEASFLHFQDIDLLPGIGAKLSQRMELLGIKHIGELAGLSDSDILTVLGKKGLRLRNCARGVDNTPITPLPSHMKKISEHKMLASDTSDRGELEAHLFLLSEETGLKLRQNNLTCKGVEVVVSYTDGMEARESLVFQEHTFYDREIFENARTTLEKIFYRRVRVRKITLFLIHLSEGAGQLDLFIPENRIKLEKIQKSIDHIRARFGKEAITFGRTINIK